MKLRPKHVTYAAMLLLAGGVVAWDQASRASAEDVSAPAVSTASIPDTGGPLVPAAAEAPSAPARSRPSLAQRLERAADGLPDAPRDAFTPDPAWIAAAPPPARADPAAAVPPDVRAFRQRVVLSAVLADRDGERLAVIDGVVRRVGDTVEGFRLVSIDEAAATFQRGDFHVRLRVGRAERP